jgi:hypothetical protein
MISTTTNAQDLESQLPHSAILSVEASWRSAIAQAEYIDTGWLDESLSTWFAFEAAAIQNNHPPHVWDQLYIVWDILMDCLMERDRALEYIQDAKDKIDLAWLWLEDWMNGNEFAAEYFYGNLYDALDMLGSVDDNPPAWDCAFGALFAIDSPHTQNDLRGDWEHAVDELIRLIEELP